MLQKGIIFLYVFFLVAHFVCAEQEIIDVQLMKEEYSAGETVQIRLVVEPLERHLKADQLALYVGSVKKPIAPFFTQYNEDTYLLYFDLPIVIDGATYFKVERILYRGSAGLQEYTVEKEIPIIREPTSVLSIIPGFIVLEKNQDEIQLQIENRKGDTLFNISTSPSITHVYNIPQTINLGNKRMFRFRVDQSKIEPDTAITIEHTGQKYTIAVMKRQGSQTLPYNQTTMQESNKLTFLAAQPEVRKTITKDTSLFGTISLKNEGNATIDGIIVELTGNLESITILDTTFIPSLQPEEAVDITITMNKDQEGALGIYEGNIVARAGALQAVFPVTVTIETKQPGELINRTNIDLNLKKTEIIDRGEEFDINISQQPQSEKETEYPIGLILITLFLLFSAIGFYLLKRKKTVKEETFDDYIKKIRK